MKTPPAYDVAAVPIAVATLARVLARHDDYRVQSRIRTMERREAGLSRTGELAVCVLHQRTLGPESSTGRIVELSLQTVRIDGHGRIVDTGRNQAWFEDPGVPIPSAFEDATGVSDQDVRGRSIPDGEAYGEISSADLVLSHEPRDRPIVERRLELEAKPWVCSSRDLDWREHGFDDASLAGLLHRCGRFYDAGGAAAEVNALLHLLDHRLSTGGTVMKELLRSAARPTWRVMVPATPTGAEILPSRGYRFSLEARHYWRDVAEGDLHAERKWVADNVLGGGREPAARRITWKERWAE